MQNFIYCCGFEQSAKRYDLPHGKKAWKRLYFMDECGICGRAIATLQECSKDGQIKTLKRCSGEKAMALRDKLALCAKEFKITNLGTLQKERTLYNNKGVIYNFNNRKVGMNEEFCALN